MMARSTRSVWAGWVLTVALLTTVYALTLASANPWDLAIGAVVSTVLLVGSRRFLQASDATVEFDRDAGRPGSVLRRAIAFIPLAGVVLIDVVKGTWDVALVVLHLRPIDHPGIVAIPIGERTPVGVAVSGLAAALPPGAFLIDVDWEEGVMLFHVLDASDPDAVRAGSRHFYERYQRAVFP